MLTITLISCLTFRKYETPVIASGKAAPACRPQNTMPIFLSWIGALRSWQPNSIVIGSPNTIRRAGPLNLQHKNGTGMVGPFQDKSNEIHFGTVLWTVLGKSWLPSGFNLHLPRSVRCPGLVHELLRSTSRPPGNSWKQEGRPLE